MCSEVILLFIIHIPQILPHTAHAHTYAWGWEPGKKIKHDNVLEGIRMKITTPSNRPHLSILSISDNDFES